MRQATLASIGFERFGKTPRRVAFLAEMDQVVLWTDLCQLIEPVYPAWPFPGGSGTHAAHLPFSSS